METKNIMRETGHRGDLVPGGLSEGTKVLMADGSIKNIENIRVGDKLIDSFGRATEVNRIKSGEGELFRVGTLKEPILTATENYKLNVMRVRSYTDPNVMAVKVKHWNEIPEAERKCFTPLCTSLDKFPEAETYSQYPIDPYFLGLLLGDGCFSDSRISITTMDREVVDEIYKEAGDNHMNVRVVPAGKARTYYLSRNSTTDGINLFNEGLRNLGLFGCRCEDKFVPDMYLYGDIDTRREVIAGLLDTDGSLSETGYDFITKSKTLANNLVFMCHSVGLKTALSECIKGCQNGFTGKYYRLYISGCCSRIPCRVEHKRITLRKQRTAVKRLFVTPAGIGKYYGLVTGMNHCFLLSDFGVASDAVTPGEL